MPRAADASTPQAALEAVEKGAQRRIGRGDVRQPLAELHILEPDLWSAIPEQVWAMEVRLLALGRQR